MFQLSMLTSATMLVAAGENKTFRSKSEPTCTDKHLIPALRGGLAVSCSH